MHEENDKNVKNKKEKCAVPIWEKVNLTLTEASEYFNIGINKLRDMTDANNCPYVLFVGSKRLIKRIPFTNYLMEARSI